MLLSVVVPVFNTEKFLPNCLDSIKNQQFSDFEVILVDDGSTDKSSSICDKYAEIDDRFTVYHQKTMVYLQQEIMVFRVPRVIILHLLTATIIFFLSILKKLEK